MSKTEKLREKFFSKPPPKDFTWNQLITLMQSYGYELKPGKGSHNAFYCQQIDHYIRGIPQPHPGNEVLACYLRQIKKSLYDEGVISHE